MGSFPSKDPPLSRNLERRADWRSEVGRASSCREPSCARFWLGERVGPTGGDRERPDSLLWWELRLTWDGDTDMDDGTEMGSKFSSYATPVGT